jgi:hypothetical protein
MATLPTEGRRKWTDACMLPVALPLEIITASKAVDVQKLRIPDGLANPGH